MYGNGTDDERTSEIEFPPRSSGELNVVHSQVCVAHFHIHAMKWKLCTAKECKIKWIKSEWPGIEWKDGTVPITSFTFIHMGSIHFGLLNFRIGKYTRPLRFLCTFVPFRTATIRNGNNIWFYLFSYCRSIIYIIKKTAFCTCLSHRICVLAHSVRLRFLGFNSFDCFFFGHFIRFDSTLWSSCYGRSHWLCALVSLRAHWTQTVTTSTQR